MKKRGEQKAPKTVQPEPSNTTTSSGPVVAKVANGVMLTIDLLGVLRAADSLESAVAVLAPVTPKADATHTLNTSCPDPLPQRRGASLKVIAVAARLNRPFKVADVVAALPDLKSTPYWTRRLAKTGHLAVVTE
jgi:hypothetical protein